MKGGDNVKGKGVGTRMSLWYKYNGSLLALLLLMTISCSSCWVSSFSGNVNRISVERWMNRKSARSRHSSVSVSLFASSSSSVEDSDANDDSFVFGSVERVFCISDLHTDSPDNMKWLQDLCSDSEGATSRPGRKDALIVAGDISHELDRLEETLRLLTSELECPVFFVPGNHEAWLDNSSSSSTIHSLDKLNAVQSLCQSIPNVYVDYALLGHHHSHPVWICPIQSWYDGSLDLGPDFADLCTGFEHWPWTDFFRCEWPQSYQQQQQQQQHNHTQSLLFYHQHPKMPSSKLVEHFLDQNQPSLQHIIHSYSQQQQQQQQHTAGLITFSHFLPNQQTLPDWKDLTEPKFQRKEWLDHPVPEISAKFARVAGSILIDEQLRSIHHQLASSTTSTTHPAHNLKHLHVFGHSHRPKDFLFKNIRYIHNPLGKPAERNMNMISSKATFQLVWDTTNGGEVHGEQIIRYWEQKGGGVDLLARNMKHSRLRKRVQLKRSLRELKSNQKTNK